MIVHETCTVLVRRGLTLARMRVRKSAYTKVGFTAEFSAAAEVTSFSIIIIVINSY